MFILTFLSTTLGYFEQTSAQFLPNSVKINGKDKCNLSNFYGTPAATTNRTIVLEDFGIKISNIPTNYRAMSGLNGLKRVDIIRQDIFEVLQKPNDSRADYLGDYPNIYIFFEQTSLEEILNHAHQNRDSLGYMKEHKILDSLGNLRSGYLIELGDGAAYYIDIPGKQLLGIHIYPGAPGLQVLKCMLPNITLLSKTP
ncbi:hypothetical protein CY0110_14270 [Crocosphaera chwakensis CCY0110]|uniref:Uncharacterized protein n=1 Tax=Crocosphaera chwakensis CCY0110 TaxID=391612 RepID=A3IXU7_9CHRO|nr:hypothetical protein CY0110_14270 [Crocosphaera chwakensis CCY0110]